MRVSVLITYDTCGYEFGHENVQHTITYTNRFPSSPPLYCRFRVLPRTRWAIDELQRKFGIIIIITNHDNNVVISCNRFRTSVTRITRGRTVSAAAVIFFIFTFFLFFFSILNTGVITLLTRVDNDRAKCESSRWRNGYTARTRNNLGPETKIGFRACTAHNNGDQDGFFTFCPRCTYAYRRARTPELYPLESGTLDDDDRPNKSAGGEGGGGPSVVVAVRIGRTKPWCIVVEFAREKSRDLRRMRTCCRYAIMIKARDFQQLHIIT